MYPRQFADSFWFPSTRDDVFVAMDFSDEYRLFFTSVVKPACDACALNAVRVDLTASGDSIITRILEGIMHSRLVLAEISTLRHGDKTSRNGNVMWEVGVAHALRQPCEVILLRRDNDSLLFDISAIQVHRYDPTDATGASTYLTRIINDRLHSIDQQRGLLVERAVRRLDPGSVCALFAAVPLPESGTTFSLTPTMRNQLIFPRLVELGILSFAGRPVAKEQAQRVASGDLTALCQYEVTPFGRAVLRRFIESMGVDYERVCAVLRSEATLPPQPG